MALIMRMGLLSSSVAAASLMLLGTTTAAASSVPAVRCGSEQANLPYCDIALSLDERISDLVSRLSVDEKVCMHHTLNKGGGAKAFIF